MKKFVLIIFLTVLTGCSANTKPDSSQSSSAPATPAASTSSEIVESAETEESYLVYDVQDSETVEKITEAILNSENEKRANLNIRIYTLDDYTERNIWLAETSFSDEKPSYWLYVSNADKLTEIQEEEFSGKLTGIQKRNHSDSPIYEETNR